MNSIRFVSAARATTIVTCVWALAACGGGQENASSASDPAATDSARQTALGGWSVLGPVTLR
jgi:hypothetical protein